MNEMDGPGSSAAQELAAREKLAKETMEHRRFERMRASLSIKYHPMAVDEEAALTKQGAYVPPQSYKANTSETRDFNRLASEDNAVSEDISLGGLKITTPVPLPAGTRVWVEIGMPDVPIPVSAIAEVRWSRLADGVWTSGLKFSGISKSDLEKVERFLVLQKRAMFAKRG